MNCETCDQDFTPIEECVEGLCYRCSLYYRRIEKGASISPQKHIVDPDTFSQIVRGFDYIPSYQGFDSAQRNYNGTYL